MALAQIEMTVELREISLKDRPRQLFDISPKGTVPVLQFENGDVIDESLAIMLWCSNQKKDQLWHKNDGVKQLQLIAIIDDDFKTWLDSYKYHDRYSEHPQEFYRGKCESILNEFEDMLKKNQFLTHDKFQLVDAAVFPFIRQFANVDKNWFDHAFVNLSNWLTQIQDSALFANVMQKYEFWHSGDKPLIITFAVN